MSVTEEIDSLLERNIDAGDTSTRLSRIELVLQLMNGQLKDFLERIDKHSKDQRACKSAHDLIVIGDDKTDGLASIVRDLRKWKVEHIEFHLKHDSDVVSDGKWLKRFFMNNAVGFVLGISQAIVIFLLLHR